MSRESPLRLKELFKQPGGSFVTSLEFVWIWPSKSPTIWCLEYWTRSPICYLFLSFLVTLTFRFLWSPGMRWTSLLPWGFVARLANILAIWTMARSKVQGLGKPPTNGEMMRGILPNKRWFLRVGRISSLMVSRSIFFWTDSVPLHRRSYSLQRCLYVHTYCLLFTYLNTFAFYSISEAHVLPQFHRAYCKSSKFIPLQEQANLRKKLNGRERFASNPLKTSDGPFQKWAAKISAINRIPYTNYNIAWVKVHLSIFKSLQDSL